MMGDKVILVNDEVYAIVPNENLIQALTDFFASADFDPSNKLEIISYELHVKRCNKPQR